MSPIIGEPVLVRHPKTGAEVAGTVIGCRNRDFRCQVRLESEEIIQVAGDDLARPPALLEEVGNGSLDLSGDGQHTDCLKRDRVSIQNRPPAVGWCDKAYISVYDGTDFAQWHGRRGDGCMHPHGKIMRLTEAGKAKLAEAKAAYEAAKAAAMLRNAGEAA